MPDRKEKKHVLLPVAYTFPNIAQYASIPPLPQKHNLVMRIISQEAPPVVLYCCGVYTCIRYRISLPLSLNFMRFLLSMLSRSTRIAALSSSVSTTPDHHCSVICKLAKSALHHLGQKQKHEHYGFLRYITSNQASVGLCITVHNPLSLAVQAIVYILYTSFMQMSPIWIYQYNLGDCAVRLVNMSHPLRIFLQTAIKCGLLMQSFFF